MTARSSECHFPHHYVGCRQYHSPRLHRLVCVKIVVGRECRKGTMDIHSDLPDFSSRCRLFPLPNLVLFPHAILPLHIFEPRYRQMTEDALGDDHLVTIVQVKPIVYGTSWTEPVPIMDVGCLGRIVQHERLAGRRFNFLLLGCKRVRLCERFPTRSFIGSPRRPSWRIKNPRHRMNS